MYPEFGCHQYPRLQKFRKSTFGLMAAYYCTAKIIIFNLTCLNAVAYLDFKLFLHFPLILPHPSPKVPYNVPGQ